MASLFYIDFAPPVNPTQMSYSTDSNSNSDSDEPPPPAVTIERLYSRSPSVQENYAVSCNSHRISTTVTAKPSVVRHWVSRIRYRHRHRLRKSRLVVGLGVQWAPGASTPATLQLCVGRNCLIFQLKYADRSPSVLRRLLYDPDVLLVGIWNYRDEEMLRESRHGLRVRGLVDVRHVAERVMWCGGRMSMGRLAEKVLGFEGVEKREEVGRSEWGKGWLSDEQVEYAVVDVFVCCMVAKNLRVWKYGYDL